MNFFSRFFRSRDKPTNLLGGLVFLFGPTAAGKVVNERTAMQTTAVYACVRILAESIAGLPLHVYAYKGQGKERVPEHPLYFLLHDAPNPEMTSFVFRETLMTHLLLWGNAYAQILRDGMGRVIGLYPLLPDRMDVGRDSKTGELYYLYTRSTEENPNFKAAGQIRLRREDVLHIPGRGFDGLVGYSPIVIAKNAIGIVIVTKEHRRDSAVLCRGAPRGDYSTRLIRLCAIGDKAERAERQEQRCEHLREQNQMWLLRRLVRGEGVAFDGQVPQGDLSLQ